MAVFIFEYVVGRWGVFLFEEVGCPLLVVKITVVVMGLAVILVVGILTVEVVGREVGMMVVLGTEWGYEQGSKGWLECVVNFCRKKYLLPKV